MNQLENPSDTVLASVAEHYTVRTTPEIDRLVQHPAIARQYLPDARELDTRPDENADPIGDNAHMPVKGIVHRYPDRVLLKPHHACAVYCRFCFRRDMVGRNGERLTDGELETAVDYIRQSPEIWEVILTGGDPFALSSRRLAGIFQALDDIPHVKVIRVHTRVPVAAPELVDENLCRVLQTVQKPLTVSVHCNHPAELSASVSQALARLHKAGAVLVSQSVLLKGVNDKTETLEALFRRLVENRVSPYYLHHPDKARGTSHFRVKLSDGLRIYQKLRGALSGQCIPHYMLDIPGGYGKVPVNSQHIQVCGDHYRVTDMTGVTHIYRD